MIGTVSSTMAPSASAQQAPPVNLGAELAKYEKQLADWVHCPSCKTPEGKAKIDEISTKINAIKSRMERVDQALEPADSQPRLNDGASANPAATATEKSGRTLSLDGLGAYIDLYA